MQTSVVVVVVGEGKKTWFYSVMMRFFNMTVVLTLPV